MKRIRVLLADDQPIFVEGVRKVLEPVEDIEIVGSADSEAKVLPAIANLQPEFVLMDFLNPSLDGLACLERVRSRYPNVRIALISAVREPGVIESALRRGACAFVLKTIDPNDLAGVIHQVMNGTVFRAADVAEPESVDPSRSAAGLTEREGAILQALARGLSNDAIAKELWITKQTVKFHLRNVYRKLGVSNRTEAARYAYQHSLAPGLEDELLGLAVSR
ncbi:MAG: response regulator transcription factor [Actinobacteria bacterium]|nr:response regulator transcription factor [Actinomycetota bacterium]